MTPKEKFEAERDEACQSEIFNTKFGYEGRELELAIRMANLFFKRGYEVGYQRGVEENPTADKIFRLQRELASEFALADRLAGAAEQMLIAMSGGADSDEVHAYGVLHDALAEYNKARGKE